MTSMFLTRDLARSHLSTVGSRPSAIVAEKSSISTTSRIATMKLTARGQMLAGRPGWDLP